MHPNVFRETHGFKHLRPEHSTISNFNPLFEQRVESEDLHRRLSEVKIDEIIRTHASLRRVIPLYTGYKQAWSAVDGYPFYWRMSSWNLRYVHVGIPISERKLGLPMRSDRVRLWSATTPSTWWNSARCVASRVSFRNTRSMLKSFAGLKPPGCEAISFNNRADEAVVCVRRSSFRDSDSFHGAR